MTKNTKKDVKKNVFPHTQAKLDLFKGYLEHYLRVLCYADFCKQINLFDIYCGAGLYEDGKKGSPLLAVDCIRSINTEIQDSKKDTKSISLTINDYDSSKIENVRNNVDYKGIENCSITYYNKDANEMLDVVANCVSKTPTNQRNLTFIDPYGYSAINKDKIIKLLNNKYTEIILFLPVMQMYRFTDVALCDTENKPHFEIYELTLRNEFLPKHANGALRNLIKKNKIQDITNSIGYGVSYNNYKNKNQTSIFTKI
jgi:three-Cys-motif partner protein